jgi:predicted Zn finger-like uncharacterized protein
LTLAGEQSRGPAARRGWRGYPFFNRRLLGSKGAHFGALFALADTPMLIVCPNCATSYGVEMASLRPARGWTRKLRCHHCRWVWQAPLSNTDKLLATADAVPPVRRAMAAIAQAAADAAWSALPRLRRATAVLAEELEAARTRADRAPIQPAGFHAEPAGADLAGATVTPLIAGISAIAARVIGAVRRQPWRRSWRPSWWLSWRQSWWLWRPSLSRLQCVILGLALTDAAIIGERADLVWAMPQTASFYATLGLPVNLRGIHFDRLAATAERHDGEPILIVQGEIGNSTTESADVPHLRFAIRNAEHQEIYSWTAAPARGRLSAGHRLAFHSELALPPPDTRDVVVRFIDRENTF